MQEILDVVRYVAIFYLLEQLVLNLTPGKPYIRYVKFYLGLLLALLLMQPALRIFRLADHLDAEALAGQLEREVEEYR